jgi:carbon monoxide dehydrogenase subunit G
VARNERYIPVPARQVFEVLSDARHYGYMIVGSKEIREADPRWPRKGAAFHHTLGYGPLNVRDSTEVVDVDAPRMLTLQARAGLLGAAKVTFELEGANGGTRVSMIEDPVVPTIVLPLTLPFHVLTRLRNRETLRRLDRLAQAAPAERERLAREEGSENEL